LAAPSRDVVRDVVVKSLGEVRRCARLLEGSSFPGAAAISARRLIKAPFSSSMTG